MIDPRPSRETSKSMRLATGGSIHDDWRLINDAKSTGRAVASRQALTPPVQTSHGIQ